MRLANLLPKTFSRSPISPNNKPNKQLVSHHFDYVRDWWDTRNDKETLSSAYHLRRLVAELSLELQAFVLRDEEGVHVKTEYPPGYAPLLDPYHLQPLNNIAYLEQPIEVNSLIVTEANERIEIETKIVEDKAVLAKPQSDSQARRAFQLTNFDTRAEYRIDNRNFSEIGLSNLANRARQRFFFILAAEEILNALVGPETQTKLNRVWYVEQSGTTRGHLYVKDDLVKVYPPILFSFVVDAQVSRIRRCEICEDYFWAGRKDKKVCSARCGATRRKRNERERYFEIKVGARRVNQSGKKRTSKARLQSGVKKKGK
jgi:hypothetical protein